MDKMTIDEFRKLSIEEICERITKQYHCEHFSNTEVMHANGYDFSWTTMENEAKKLGLVRGYVISDQNHFKKPTEQENLNIKLGKKKDPVEHQVTFEREEWNRFQELAHLYKANCDKSAILGVAFKIGLDTLEKAAQEGRLKVYKEMPDFCYKPKLE